jgi:hypothetical protein
MRLAVWSVWIERPAADPFGLMLGKSYMKISQIAYILEDLLEAN